ARAGSIGPWMRGGPARASPEDQRRWARSRQRAARGSAAALLPARSCLLSRVRGPVARERAPQPAKGFVEPRLDGRFRKAQLGGDVVQGLVLEEVQIDHDTLSGGEASHGASQVDLQGGVGCRWCDDPVAEAEHLQETA